VRTVALALVAIALVSMGILHRVSVSRRPPVEPLACPQVVFVADPRGDRVACPDDPALEGCGEVRPGARYVGCVAEGVVRGPLLALHGQPLDVALATAEDFRALPRVGGGLARRLVERREKQPICSADDLEEVPGVGPKRAAALAARLSFDSRSCATTGAE
jgi:hypothetical protein